MVECPKYQYSVLVGIFWDDFPHKKIPSEIWTHPPTSIVITEFFNYAKPPKKWMKMYQENEVSPNGWRASMAESVVSGSLSPWSLTAITRNSYSTPCSRFLATASGSLINPGTLDKIRSDLFGTTIVCPWVQHAHTPHNVGPFKCYVKLF